MSPIFLDENEGEPKMYYDEVDVRQQLRRERRTGFWMGIISSSITFLGLLWFVGWYISG